MISRTNRILISTNKLTSSNRTHNDVGDTRAVLIIQHLLFSRQWRRRYDILPTGYARLVWLFKSFFSPFLNTQFYHLFIIFQTLLIKTIYPIMLKFCKLVFCEFSLKIQLFFFNLKYFLEVGKVHYFINLFSNLYNSVLIWDT